MADPPTADLVARIRDRPNDAPMPTERLLDEAADGIETLTDVILDLLASLVAAVSLLKRGSKKAAPSDRMFDQMIVDYEQSIARARAALKEQQS